MLSRSAAEYVEHQAQDKPMVDVVAKWNRTYRDDAIDIAEAQAFYDEVERLCGGGMPTFTAVNAALAKMAKSKMKVVSKKVKKARK